MGSEPDDCSLYSLFRFVLDEGGSEKEERWCRDSALFKAVNQKIPALLSQYMINAGFTSDVYKVIGRSGSSGRWSNTMYICLMNESSKFGSTYTASRGIYACYLVTEGCKAIYLTYMLSVGAKKIRELKELRARMLPDTIPPGFSSDTSRIIIDPDPHLYRDAVIIFKEYTIETLPDDPALYSDVGQLLGILQSSMEKYYEAYNEVVLKRLSQYGRIQEETGH